MATSEQINRDLTAPDPGAVPGLATCRQEGCINAGRVAEVEDIRWPTYCGGCMMPVTDVKPTPEGWEPSGEDTAPLDPFNGPAGEVGE